MSDNSSEPSTPPRSGVPWMRVAKWTIAAIVAAGLYFAIRSATQQWTSQHEQLAAEIALLDQQWEAESDPAKRRLLSIQREQLEASVPRLMNLRWQWIGLASLLYGVSLLPPGVLLGRAVDTLGQPVPLRIALAAQLLGHVGKYVPGKAMVVVLRSGVLKQHGVRVAVGTVSVFMETFLMMAVGGAVAGAVILWLPVPTWLTLAAAAVAILASVPTLPPMLQMAANRLTHTDQTLPRGAATRLFVVGWICSLTSWLLIGGSFTAIIYAIPSATAMPPLGTGYAVATAAISLAMVIGFASLLPGGAGVRELVLTTILGVSLGTAHGLIAALAARFIFLVVEVVLALVCWIGLRRAAR